MEKNDKIIAILNEIIILLELSEEDFWLSYFNNIKHRFLTESDETTICQSILKSFQGGMGSFNDLVLHKDGKPLIEENNKLDELKENLFDYCYNM